MKMTDLERLRATYDYLDEKLRDDLKEIGDDPTLRQITRETYQEHKQAFASAIRALESQAVPKTIYIAGPITGKPNYHAEFGAEEARLISKGYAVLNPAKLPQGLSYEQYARIDFAMIDAADAVVMLPKWDESQGARLEFDYCRYTGKPVYFSAEVLLGAQLKEAKP